MQSTQQQKAGFRAYIPSPETPRSKELAAADPYTWAAARCREPFIANWKQTWEALYAAPYKGITTDGNPRPEVHRRKLATMPGGGGGGAPTAEMVRAAQAVLDLLASSPEQREAIVRPVDASEWRRWMNPEIYMYDHGLRLEEISDERVVNAVYRVLRASLSPAGYAKARGCMKVNRFLGEVVNGAGVLNERSYNFTLFGEPSMHEPWGWQFHGHHFCMNCFVLGERMVVSPVFMGAEPNVIDEGPDKGLELFTDQERLALDLMASVDEATRRKIQLYEDVTAVPEGRFHRADQRHLGGAFQDNRVIPYEGLPVSSLPVRTQGMVRDLLVLSLNYLQEGALVARMAEIEDYWTETYLCWIGGIAQNEAFYYKIHSSVVMIEFDHHTGVFLSNEEPLPFHIHTLVRTPNGNDYGKELLRQHRLGLDS
jgi:hypothetical protein